MSRGEERQTLSAKRVGARQCRLESHGKKFKVNSLLNSEPVEIVEMLCYMGTWVEVKNSTKCKVLYSLELGKVS